MHKPELRFQVPPEQRDALLAHLRRGRLSVTSRRTYCFDTVEGLLAQHEITVCLRHQQHRWVQTVKISGRRGAASMEHAVELDAQGDALPTLDLERHHSSPAIHKRLRRALHQDQQAVGSTSLKEVYRTALQRHTRTLRAPGGGMVGLVFDEGNVIAGETIHPVCELAIYLQAGPLSALFDLAGPWMERHALWLDAGPAAAPGARPAQGREHAPAVEARPASTSSSTDARAFARAAVSSCLAQVLPNASAVAWGSMDVEHVHQLRIGLRRLRTVLREMAEFDCGLDPAWEPAMAEVFGLLGAERDRHLLLTRIATDLLAAGAPTLPRPPATQSAKLARLLRSPQFQGVLLAALAFSLDASPAAGPAFDGTPLEALAARLDQLHREVRRGAKRFAGQSTEQQHRLRKRLKRLRYVAEFLAPLFRAPRVADYLASLRPAQDALGIHNDELVALRIYRLQAEQDPAELGAWFASGWLSARQLGSAQAAAKALRRAGKARRFWHGRVRP